MRAVLTKKTIDVLFRTVQDHANVFVAGFPGLLQEDSRLLLIERRQAVAQPIERSSEWCSPLLRPTRMPAGIATAVRAPALYPVNTAPRTVLHDFREMVRWVFLQKLSVIGQLRQLVRLNVMKRISERHFAEAMMMTVAFSVRGDVHELRPLPRVGEAAHQAVGEALPVVEHPLERYTL